MYSQIIILLLFADALLVTVGLLRHKNMWRWITLYWTLLTLKNFSDFIYSLG